MLIPNLFSTHTMSSFDAKMTKSNSVNTFDDKWSTIEPTTRSCIGSSTPKWLVILTYKHQNNADSTEYRTTCQLNGQWTVQININHGNNRKDHNYPGISSDRLAIKPLHWGLYQSQDDDPSRDRRINRSLLDRCRTLGVGRHVAVLRLPELLWFVRLGSQKRKYHTGTGTVRANEP